MYWAAPTISGRGQPQAVRPAVNVCEARWRATLRDLKSDQTLLVPTRRADRPRPELLPLALATRPFRKQPARSARPRKADGRPLANGAAGRTGLDILDVGATV